MPTHNHDVLMHVPGQSGRLQRDEEHQPREEELTQSCVSVTHVFYSELLRRHTSITALAVAVAKVISTTSTDCDTLFALAVPFCKQTRHKGPREGADN